MDRETKTIETPAGKHKVEIKTYLIGREKRALTNIYLSKDMSVNTEDKQITGFANRNIIEEAENLALQTMIVSIDGKHDGDDVEGIKFSLIDCVLDMRSEDYDFIVNAINDVTSEKKIAKS